MTVPSWVGWGGLGPFGALMMPHIQAQTHGATLHLFPGRAPREGSGVGGQDSRPALFKTFQGECVVRSSFPGQEALIQCQLLKIGWTEASPPEPG